MRKTEVANAENGTQPPDKVAGQLFFRGRERLQVCLLFLKLLIIDLVLRLTNRTINMSV